MQAAKDGGIGDLSFETRTSRQPRWWDVVVSPIYDADGKPERLLALSRDVTEHKKNEIALCEAIHFNREIIEGAAEGIIVYDSELRYQLFNPFMERLTGKRSQEVLGRVATEVFPRLGPSGIETALKRALQGEVVQVADALVPKHSADGRDLWESCTFAPHCDAQGKVIGVIGLVRDVTERHLAEETFRPSSSGRLLQPETISFLRWCAIWLPHFAFATHSLPTVTIKNAQKRWPSGTAISSERSLSSKLPTNPA